MTNDSSDRFLTTHWSLVLRAGGEESSQAEEALAELCECYWYPLYAFVRRRGNQAAEAQDLTQEFFLRLLEKNYVAQAQRERGRFRAFLLASMKNFLANQRDRERAVKRGGGRRIVSLDFRTAEARYAREPRDDATPERLFERQWTLTLLARVLDGLRAQYAAAGNERQFERLKAFITSEKGAVPYAEVGEELGLSEGAVKTAVHRLRKRYRKLLEREIGQTVEDPAEIESELKQLFASLAAGKSNSPL